MNRRWEILLLFLAALAVGVSVIVSIAYPTFAAVLVGLVAGLLLLRFPGVFALVCGATLPFAASLALNTPLGAFSFADMAAIGGVLAVVLVDGKIRALFTEVRVGLWLLVAYLAVATLTALAVAAPSAAYATVLQRLELVGVWLLFGVIVVRKGAWKWFVTAFAAASIVLALAWIASPGEGAVLGVQKNPSGSMLAAAIILVMFWGVRWYLKLAVVAVLAGGLVASGSRGSIIGLAVAAVVILVFAKQWRRTFVPLAVLAGVGVVALQVLPAQVVDRLFGGTSDAQYTSDIRYVFIRDALAQWNDNPLGVGVGQYRQIAAALQRIATHDPHNVYVLALVEGGIPLLIAFTVLAGGSLIWLLTMKKDVLVVAALAVQVSLLVHASVDVYWVRGTASIGWMLVGVAAATAAAGGRGAVRDVVANNVWPPSDVGAQKRKAHVS
ncbi:MAG: O-antigen ligase family protein [Microbacteriaceae bacterium]